MPPCTTPDVLVTDGMTNVMAILAVPLGISLSYWVGMCCLWSDTFGGSNADGNDMRRVRYVARRLQVLATTCSTIISLTLLGLAAIAMVRWTGEPSECVRRSLGVEWFVYMCLVDLTFGTVWEFVLLWALGIDVQVFQQPLLAVNDDDMDRQRRDFRHRKLPALLLIQVLLTMSLKGSSVLLAVIMDQDPPGYGWATRVSPWTVRGAVVGVMVLYASVRVLVLDISRGWRTVQLKTPGLYVRLQEFKEGEPPLPPPPPDDDDQLSLDVRSSSSVVPTTTASPDIATGASPTPPESTPEPRPTLLTATT